MSEQREAISYDRFSDPRQSRGDSAGRQSRAYTGFCRRHKLRPAAQHFADRGRSGYKGTHRTKGDLGRFEALVKDGTVPRGTVLVIEAWDRLSRERPDKVIALVSSILSAGVDIGVTRLDDIFTESDLGTHKFTTLSIFAQLAHEESRQKSERITASWKTRHARARADRQLATTRAPGWIEARNGKFRLIPERAAAVKRIFDLAAAGYGQARIVKALIDEGIRPFGEVIVREGRSRSHFSGEWRRAYIRLILNDRRAVGEYQPMRNKKPEGTPIPAYYPSAVTEQEYLLARLAQETRKIKRSGPRQRKYINVFQTLLRNTEDGEGFWIGSRGTATRPDLVLRSATGVEGRRKTVTFPYAVFETEILKRLREIDASAIEPAKDKAPNRLDVLQAEHKDAVEQVQQLTADLRKGYSAAVSAVLREQEIRRDRLKEELAEEQARAAHPAEKDWQSVKNLADAVATSEDPDDARLRLRTVLRRAVDEIWVRIVSVGAVRLCAVQVWFAEGKTHRDYLIRYRPAGNGRSQQVETADTTDATIDLRDPAQARQLAADLVAAELDVE